MTASAPSVRRRLLSALVSTILLVWVVVVVLVYRAAQHEVEEVFDADLARSARILQTLLLHEVDEEKETGAKVRAAVEELGEAGLARYPGLAANLRQYTAEEIRERLELVRTAQQAGNRYGAGLVFVARYADGSIMVQETHAPQLPLTVPGYVDLVLGGQDWRVYRLVDQQTGFNVQVGERQAFRDELVRYITGNTLMPLLLALPILALMIWIVVGRAMLPMRRLTEQVSMRAPGALEPIAEGDAPREIFSLVSELNKLFGRVSATIERERRFTADAAHELRTPLAALKAHLQVAQTRAPDPLTGDSIARALDGVDRATHTVEQLLQLARADAGQERSVPAAQVDLRQLAIDGVSQLSQLAIDHDIDLGIEADAPVVVDGDRDALAVLLRNLIDNAIRYTPAGGWVTVSVGREGDAAWARVADNGPGIRPADEALVFNRFHRGGGEQAAGTTGSGIGLSIVQRIAELHGARISLGKGPTGSGLRVTVLFSDGH